MAQPSPTEIIKKVPDSTLQIAIDWAKTNPQPARGALVPGSLGVMQPTTGPDKFEVFLKGRGSSTYDFVMSLSGTGVDPGTLHKSVRQLGPEAAQAALLERSPHLKAAEPAPLPRAAVAESKEALFLKALAQKSPEGFALAQGFVKEQSRNPTLQLGDYLKTKGVEYGEYMALVKKGGAESGAVLNIMRRVPEIVEAVAQKLGEHTKVGKVVLAVGAIAAVATQSASAATVKDAAGKLAVSTASLIDPTATVGPSLLGHVVAKAVGQRSEVDEMGIDTGKISGKSGVVKAVEINNRIGREQAFLMSADHPAQLCTLTMKGKDGKDIDVVTALKDPAKRSTVMDEIDRREAVTRTAETRAMLQEMKDAAITYARLEDQRKPMPADILGAGAPKVSSPTTSAQKSLTI